MYLTRAGYNKHRELIEKWAEGAKIEYSNNGYYWSDNKTPSWSWHTDYRLAQKPDEINWDHVATKYKFMARDRNGKTFLHSQKPSITSLGYWLHHSSMIKDFESVSSHVSYARGDLPWDQSLVERPDEKH